MGLSGGAIAGIVIGCVVFVIFKSWCMWAVIRWFYRTKMNKQKEHWAASESSDNKLMAWLQTSRNRKGVSSKSSGSGGSNSSTSTAGIGAAWAIQPSDVEVCGDAQGNAILLGQGSFGQVFKGMRQGVQPVAIKTLQQADSAQLEAFHKEIALMEKLSFDRNIVQFYGACLEGPHPMLVLEFMEGGDLRQALNKDKTRSLSWYKHGKSVSLDIARGLVFLHRNKVVHSDLKAKNILLTQGATAAKISDVGLARVMMHTLGNTATGAPAGTFAYAAPEMLLGEKWDDRADVYSMGVLLWEICTAEVPVRGHLRPFRVPEECPAAVEQVVASCMARDPNGRPSARQLYDSLQAINDVLEP